MYQRQSYYKNIFHLNYQITAAEKDLLQCSCSVCRIHNTVIASFLTYYRVYNKSNTTSGTSGAGTDYLQEQLDSTTVLSEVRVAPSLVFHVVFCRLLFVILPSFSLHCLSFALWLLITSLVSLTFSCDKSRLSHNQKRKSLSFFIDYTN